MPLNEHSFQDALRTFFQPIKNDDARLDFYAMYKKEATEYDTEYVKKYDEDLNTTLIFVSCMSSTPTSYLTVLVGGSVLCCQFRFRYRRPLGTTTRSERAIRSSPPCNPPHPQSICRPKRIPYRSTRPRESPQRDCHRHRTHVRESPDLAARRVRRDVGQAMAQPVPAACGWINDRALWRSSTQVRRTEEMAVPPLRRESPGDAPGRAPPPGLRTVQTHVVHQHHYRRCSHHPHCPWSRLLPWYHNCGDIFI